MYSVTESHRTGALIASGITVLLGSVAAYFSVREVYILAVPTGAFALYFLVQALKYWRLHSFNGAITLNLFSERLPESRDFEGELVFSVPENLSKELIIELQCFGRDNHSADAPIFQDPLATMRANDVAIFQKSLSAPLEKRVRFKFHIPQEVPPSWSVPRTLESRPSTSVRWAIGVRPSDPNQKGPRIQFDLPYHALTRD